MKYIILMLSIAISGCDLWKNDEVATLEQSIRNGSSYYSHYSQHMWDGTIQFLVKTDSTPLDKIDSPDGQLNIDDSAILVQDFMQSNYKEKASLSIKDGVIVFCSAIGCKKY